MIDKDISLDTTRTSCLKPELKQGIETGDLLSSENISNIETGNLLSSESVNGIVTGDLLTPQPLPVTSNFPLNYARIGYENILKDSDVAVSVAGGQDGGSESVGNLLTPSTWDKWRVSELNSGDSRFEWVTLKAVNYVGIAAHNAGTAGAFINIYTSIDSGSNWDLIANFSPANDSAIFFRFTETSINGLRVVIGTAGMDLKEIGVIYLGKELEMMRPNYSGYSPAKLSSKDVFTPQVSDGGQFLGKQLVRKGFATEANFRHLTYDWYEAEFQPFVIHAKTLPYFWSWNLEEHPNEVVYGWTNENIKPTLMGVRNWLEVSFNIDAHGDL